VGPAALKTHQMPTGPDLTSCRLMLTLSSAASNRARAGEASEREHTQSSLSITSRPESMISQRQEPDERSTLSSIQQPIAQLPAQTTSNLLDSGYAELDHLSDVNTVNVLSGLGGSFSESSAVRSTGQQQHVPSFSASDNPLPFQNRHLTASSQSPKSPLEQSHGTLVISSTGRSKYLGPTAASEWLKDVCLLCVEVC
jgi:hypothetical protein